MVKQIVKLTLNLLLLFVTITLLCIVREKSLLLSLTLIAQLEMLLLIWIILKMIGKVKPRMFRFLHLSKKTNSKENVIEILNEVTKKELKNLHYKFKFSDKLNIYIEESTSLKKLAQDEWVELVGLVRANNKKEALQIISEHQFYETD